MISCKIKGKKYECLFNSDNVTFVDVTDENKVLIVSYDTPISSLVKFDFFNGGSIWYILLIGDYYE